MTSRTVASERIATSPVTVEFVGLDGQALPLDDDSVDTALSTWTLCSISNHVAAVREIGRVLRPGGVFRFVEEWAEDPSELRRSDLADDEAELLA